MLKKLLKKIKGDDSKKFSKPTGSYSESENYVTHVSGKRLKDKVVLVTGAGKGIGRAIAKCFASEGARVLINSRTRDDLNLLADEIKQNNGECHIFVGDVTNPEIVRSMFADLNSQFGPPDICVNSAGTAKFGFVQDFPFEDFQKIMNLNVAAAYTCIQEAVKLMEKNGNQGKIITIGSIASRWIERGGSGAYTSSKHAVYAMVESIARQLHGSGSNIAVSMLCPGVVDTPLSNPNKDPHPEWLKPETVAASALHIATAPANINIFDVTVFGMKEKPW